MKYGKNNCQSGFMLRSSSNTNVFHVGGVHQWTVACRKSHSEGGRDGGSKRLTP